VSTSPENPTRQAVLDYAVQHLWHHDESELRILDLSSHTGHSPSVIYAHFRSRTGLIDAAYCEIYRQVITRILANIKKVAATCTTQGSFVDELHRMLIQPSTWPEVMKRREMRFRIRSKAMVRTPLRKQLAAIDSEFDSQFESTFEELIKNRQLGPVFSPMEWWRFLEAIIMANPYLASTMPLTPPAAEEWHSVAQLVVKHSF